jgi:hypothetical protein
MGGKVTQDQMVKAAASEVLLGLDGAAQYVYEWVVGHPDAAVATLCKKVADAAGVPDSWKALEGRVARKRSKATTGTESGVACTESDQAARRHAKRVLKNASPEEIAELLEDDTARMNVGRALDTHYSKKTAARKENTETQEIERHGGSDEHE